MEKVPDSEPLVAWGAFGEALGGSFAARARNLFASEFLLLDRDGEPFGHLTVRTDGAEARAGDLEAEIQHQARHDYAMAGEGEEILTAKTSPESPEIWCGDRLYEARLSLLRNRAEARISENEPAVRISGRRFTNRRYEISFDAADAGSLPVATFLLYRLISLRRSAYRTG